MKHLPKKVLASLLAGAVSLSMLTACAASQDPGETGASTVQANAQGQTSPDTTGAPMDDADTSSVGSFSTQDVAGNTVTEDIFADYDLTMVNVFTTWCSPCVREMPDLEKLYQQMQEKNVGVVGIVLDVVNERGEVVPEGLDRAKLLVQQTGVTYPILVPDSTYLNGRLIGIMAVPETFFVDKDGNIVGETYTGSRSLEDWVEVVEAELGNLEGGA